MDYEAIVKENVSRETFERLKIYVALLTKWNAKINLVSKGTLDDAWARHIQDSLQIADYIDGADTKWVDMGSGGGLPGVVVALVAYERVPDLRVVLVESDARKCAFLREVSRNTGVGFEVLNSRIESVDPQSADVISARALAPLDKLLDYAFPHLAENGRCLFNKGENYKVELANARQTWNFDADIQTSVTNPTSVVVSVKELERG